MRKFQSIKVLSYSFAVCMLFAFLLLFLSTPAFAAEREEIVLNGDSWQFKPINLPLFPYEQPARDTELNRQFIRDALSNPANNWTTSTNVRVPMSWTSQTDFTVPSFWQYVHKGEYNRTFDVPSTFAGKRVKLQFNSVNLTCWVYVNGTLLKADGAAATYTHMGKYQFEVDITSLVATPSTANTLKVVVQDYSSAFGGSNGDLDSAGSIVYPLGDRREYYTSTPRSWRILDTGILEDVLLKAVPKTNVDNVFVNTSLTNNQISVDVTLRNEDTVAHTVTIENVVKEKVSGTTALTFTNIPTLTLAAGEVKTTTIIQSWTSPRLWWPYDPFLYNLNTTIKENGAINDVFIQSFGFREVKVVKSTDDQVRGFFLNNVKTNLRGESIEGTWKDGYTEGVGVSGFYYRNGLYWSYLVDVAKSMNINMIRTHRGTETQEMMDIADEKGLMLMDESTIFSTIYGEPAGTLANQQKQLREMVKTYRNHPSIIMWSLANESGYNTVWGTEVNSNDGTRPLVASEAHGQDATSLLSANSESYYNGLCGYSSNIYNNWDSIKLGGNLIYVYEDNACYDEPTNSQRVKTVQQGLTLFRGHRVSGYEMISTYYTFQKAFGQPTTPGTMLLPITWSTAEKNAKGYHPDFARMPLFDPWTDRLNPKVINPITGYTVPTTDYWKNTFSPIAVFDYEYDKRAETSTNPYWKPLDTNRKLTIFNDDDARDLTTAIHVTYDVVDPANESVVSSGFFDVTVPIGGKATQNIIINPVGRTNVKVIYKASKGGVQRFSETIYLGPAVPVQNPNQNEAGFTTIQIDNTDNGFEQSGFTVSTATGQIGADVRSKVNPVVGDYAKYNPWIGKESDYNIYLNVPSGLTGTQKVEVYLSNTLFTQYINLATPGWVLVPGSPYHMTPGMNTNSLKLITGGTATTSIADAAKFVDAINSNVTYSKNVTVDSINGVGYEGAKAVDDVISDTSRWISANTNGPHWAEIDLAGSYSISNAEVYGGFGNTFPIANIDLQYWNGSSWLSIPGASVTGNTLVKNTFIFTSPVTTTKVRLYSTDNGNVRVKELRVAGFANAPASSWNLVNDDLDAYTTGWAKTGTGGTITQNVGTVTITDDSSSYNFMTKNAFTPPTGAFTFEIRAKANAAGTTNEFAVRSGSYLIQLFTPYGTTTGSAQNSETSPLKTTALDTTVYHIYRVVVQANFTYDLYVDGVLKWSGAASAGTGANIFKLGGSANSTITANMDVDYVKMGSGVIVP